MKSYRWGERTGLLRQLKLLTWYLPRPTFWPHIWGAAIRRTKPDRDTPEHRGLARAWAEERAVPLADALAAIGLMRAGEAIPEMSRDLLDAAAERRRRVPVKMGAPADLKLLFAAARLSGAKRAVETGVAYGWSTLALLAAMEGRPGARLISVDMPYPFRGNEAWVGAVVPETLRMNWELLRRPDRTGIPRALSRLSGAIDICHYDSDKIYWGRRFAYPLLWRALAPGAVFISDNIEDNMAFAEFAAEKNAPFAVTKSADKFIGVLRKP